MKRAAVIGLGDISGIHIHAIMENPQIVLAAVCDIDEKARERAPEGVPFYTDFEEMVRQEKPDVAHICLPHYLHFPVAARLAELGVNVFCEKPVALDTAQAEEFSALEAAHPELRMGICLQNRMNDSVETLKQIIDSGEYGKVVGTRGFVAWARPRSYYDTKPWRGKWATAGGGCMNNQSIHTLDLLYYLGGTIKGVRASVSQLLGYGIEVEDTVTAVLDYEEGAKGLFFATTANYKNESVQIGVQLEKAEFLIDNNTLFRVEEDGTRVQIVQDGRLPGSKFYYGTSHGKLIGRFYQAVEEGTRDYICVKDAEMSIRLIDTIRAAGESGDYMAVPGV